MYLVESDTINLLTATGEIPVDVWPARPVSRVISFICMCMVVHGLHHLAMLLGFWEPHGTRKAMAGQPTNTKEIAATCVE